MNIPYLYDAGVLIAIDNDDRRMWARHSLALDIKPTPVIRTVWCRGRQRVPGAGQEARGSRNSSRLPSLSKA